ncbi:hypothetical protein ACFO5K_03995 [Nocardia halotolerans]|uniref:Uncharacterized protein n=1 Tax=Nocardia halotolerans TaxID=1755878 RepID=A0ABV8VDT5_9NOCA
MTLSPDDPYIQDYDPIPLPVDLSSPELDGLGIQIRGGEGPAKYWIDRDDQMWKELGFHSVELDGTIGVWPHIDLIDDEADTLREYALDAIIHKPSTASGWAHGTDGAWHCAVSVPVAEDDRAAARIAAAHAKIMRTAHKRRVSAA